MRSEEYGPKFSFEYLQCVSLMVQVSGKNKDPFGFNFCECVCNFIEADLHCGYPLCA